MSPVPPALSRSLEALLCGAPARVASVGGGDVNEAARWEAPDGRKVFVKWQAGADPTVFRAEAEGLAELRSRSGISVPQALYVSDDPPGLVLSWFDTTHPSPEGWHRLGRLLAEQHRVSADAYGLADDNFIGRLPQKNGWVHDWPTFWAERRIRPLTERAGEEKRIDRRLHERLARLAARADAFGHPSLTPSLLHGDLWGGNVAFISPSEPIVYDLAVYYGDREVELAFTELFGGFLSDFYQGYQSVWPLDEGYEGRRPYWQLYPLLVHVCMFGGSYVHSLEGAVSQAERYVS